MHNRILRHLRSNLVAYLALAVAAGAGGGYAVAASSNTKTITACANRKTGLLYLRRHGRCKRGQTRVTWNQQGPQGIQGAQGAQGFPGASAHAAWATVADTGAVVFGQNVSAQRVATGEYQVTVTAPDCRSTDNVPFVTMTNGYPPAGQGAGAFPTGWAQDTGGAQFTVWTGLVTGGAFAPSNLPFNVEDNCP